MLLPAGSCRVLERLCHTHLWGASIQGGAQQCKNRNTMPLLHGLRPEGQKTSNILNCAPSIAMVSSSPQYCENMSDQVKGKRRTNSNKRNWRLSLRIRLQLLLLFASRGRNTNVA